MSQLRILHPGAQAARFQWLYLSVLAESYPDSTNTLKRALSYYLEAKEERGLAANVAGVNDLQDVLRLGTDSQWEYFSPAISGMLRTVHEWLRGFKLMAASDFEYPLEWAEQKVVQIVTAWPRDGVFDVSEYCRKMGDAKYLPSGAMMKVSPDSSEPRALMANPQFETEEQFSIRAQKHYQESAEWYRQHGHRDELIKPAAMKHLRWLAWRIIEGLSWRAIADRDALNFGGQQGHTAVKDAVDKLPLLIGIPVVGVQF